MANLTDLSAGQRDEVTYLSGLDEDGRIAQDSWFTWNYGDFSKTQTWMNKFYNDGEGVPRASTSEAGTPGGTVTYSFSAGLSAEGQAAYTSALTLRSDIADITFKYIPTPESANAVLGNQTEGAGVTFFPNNGRQPIGGADIPSQTSPNAAGVKPKSTFPGLRTYDPETTFASRTLTSWERQPMRRAIL